MPVNFVYNCCTCFYVVTEFQLSIHESSNNECCIIAFYDFFVLPYFILVVHFHSSYSLDTGTVIANSTAGKVHYPTWCNIH